MFGLLPQGWSGEGAQLIVPEAFTEGCAVGIERDLEETVTLEFLELSEIVTVATGGTYCFRTPTQSDAVALSVSIQALARKYYPLPFPDRCSEAIQAQEALFEWVEACERDEDCAYVNENFDAIVPDGGPLLVNATRCGSFRRLPAGNHHRVIQKREELASVHLVALEACAPSRLSGAECSGSSGFSVVLQKPRCVQSKCVAADGLR